MSKILKLLNKAKHQDTEVTAKATKKNINLIADEQSVSQKMVNSAGSFEKPKQSPILILVILIAFMSAGSLMISLKTMSSVRKENGASLNLVNGVLTEEKRIGEEVEQFKKEFQLSNKRIVDEFNGLINHMEMNEEIIEKAVNSHSVLKTSFEELKSTDRLLLDKYLLLKQQLFSIEQKIQDQGRKP